MDPVDLLQGLLEQYSPTGQEAGAVAWFTGAMSALGFQARIDPAGNATGSLGDGPRELLLLGHIDTVPGLIPIRREGDALYGRGSVDAKGPLACFAAALAATGPVPGWKITVTGAVGEEGSSPGAKYVCATYPRPDAIVIGEPSGWDRITLGYKGSLWVHYSLHQAISHTAARTGSAGDQALEFWAQLQALARQLNDGRERQFDRLTFSVRAMNQASGAFEEDASLSINFRLPPWLGCEAFTAQVSALAAQASLEIGEWIPAYQAEKNNALVRCFLPAIRREGGSPGFVVKSGTSDMNLAGQTWNCPIIAYGPGDSDLDHTPEEHIRVSEYLKGIQVLSQALKRLAVDSNMSR